MNRMNQFLLCLGFLTFLNCTGRPQPKVEVTSQEADPNTLSIHGLQVRYRGVTAELLGPKEPWLAMFGSPSLDDPARSWPDLGIGIAEERDENNYPTGIIYGLVVKLALRNETEALLPFPDRLELDGVWIHPDMDWKNFKPENTEGFKDLAPDISLYSSRHERFMARWWMPPQEGRCRPVDYTLYTNGRDKVLRFEAFVGSSRECPFEKKKVVTTISEEEKNVIIDQFLFDILRTMDDSPELQAKFEQAEQEINHMKTPEREELLLELLQSVQDSSKHQEPMEFLKQNVQIGTGADYDD